MQTARKEKIYFLEGLRGAGAMAVMAGHLIGAFFPAAAFGTSDNVHTAADLPLYNLPVLHVFFDGGFAVLIFFVLSGYVLTVSPARWKTSAVKRFPRLMIPAFASVMLAYALLKSGFMFNQAVAPLSKSIWLGYFYKQPADFLSALHEALIGAVLLGHATYNSSLWTMAFEFYGALLCIALAVMCEPLRRWRTAIYLGAALIAVANLGTPGIYYAAMIFGLILTEFEKGKTWHPAIILCLMVAAFMLGGLNDGHFYHVLAAQKIEINGMVLDNVVLSKCVGAVALVAALLRSRMLQAMLSGRVFRFLGKVSFSVYLIHVPIICSLGCWIFASLYGHVAYLVAASSSILACVVTTMAVSVAYERYIDRASISISAMLSSRLLRDSRDNIVPGQPNRPAADR